MALALKTALSARIDAAMADCALDTDDAVFSERYHSALSSVYDEEQIKLSQLMALWIRVQQASPTYESMSWRFDETTATFQPVGPATKAYGKVRSIKAPTAILNLHLRSAHQEAQRWYYSHRGQGKTHYDTAANVEELAALGCSPIAIDYSRYDDSVCDEILMHLISVMYSCGLCASPFDIYIHRQMSHGLLATADPDMNRANYLRKEGIQLVGRGATRGMGRKSLTGSGVLLAIPKYGGIASGEKLTKEKGSIINRATQLYGLARVFGWKRACAIYVNSHWSETVDPQIGIHNAVLSSDDTIIMTNNPDSIPDIVNAMSETNIVTKVEVEPVYLSRWFDKAGLSFGKVSRRIVNLVYPESKKDNPLLYIGGLADMYESVSAYNTKPNVLRKVSMLRNIFKEVVKTFLHSELITDELRQEFTVDLITTRWRPHGLRKWEALLMQAMYGSKPTMHSGKTASRMLKLGAYAAEGLFAPQGTDLQLSQLISLMERTQNRWQGRFEREVQSLKVSSAIKDAIIRIARGTDSPSLYTMSNEDIQSLIGHLKF